jgi:antitoxin ParD1/3/4
VDITLTPQLKKYVQTKIKTGGYTSASEVVREALRTLEQKEQERENALEDFHSEQNRRIASLDGGESLEGEKAFVSLGKRSRPAHKKSA